MFFLGLIILGILGYSVRTGIHLWQYMRLDRQTSVQNIQWSVVSLSDEEFVPLAHYRFNVKGKSYQNQTLWQETFLNPSTAQEAIARLSESSLSVWFDVSSPETSSLQKNFPSKESFYTILLWIIGLYFLGLGYYVKGRFSS
jgi:hypothetical protein